MKELPGAEVCVHTCVCVGGQERLNVNTPPPHLTVSAKLLLPEGSAGGSQLMELMALHLSQVQFSYKL